jgi:hypothetical protein
MVYAALQKEYRMRMTDYLVSSPLTQVVVLLKHVIIQNVRTYDGIS